MKTKTRILWGFIGGVIVFFGVTALKTKTEFIPGFNNVILGVASLFLGLLSLYYGFKGK